MMKFIIDGKAKFLGHILLICLEVVLGVLLIVLPAEDIVSFVLKILGVILIVFNIVPCLYYLSMMEKDKKFSVDLVSAVISVILGILLIAMPGAVLSVILACWFVIMPIIRIIIHSNHYEQFKKEIPLLIIGLFLTVFSFSFITNIIVKIIGVMVLISSICHLIYSIKCYREVNGIVNEVNSNILDAEYKDL